MGLESLNRHFQRGYECGQRIAAGEPEKTDLQNLFELVKGQVSPEHFSLEYIPASSVSQEALNIKANECFFNPGSSDLTDYVPRLTIQKLDDEGHSFHVVVHRQKTEEETLGLDETSELLGQFCGEFGQDAQEALRIY